MAHQEEVAAEAQDGWRANARRANANADDGWRANANANENTRTQQRELIKQTNENNENAATRTPRTQKRWRQQQRVQKRIYSATLKGKMEEMAKLKKHTISDGKAKGNEISDGPGFKQ